MNMKKGFTLIEIMIVVAIIAILAAIAIPNFISYRRSAQQNACEANKKTIENAVAAYLIQNSSAAASDVTLAKLTEAGLIKEDATKCPISKESYTLSASDDGTSSAKIEVTCEHGSNTQQSGGDSQSSGSN